MLPVSSEHIADSVRKLTLNTAVFAVIELSLFLTFKNNFYQIGPSLVLSKLYSNSLLVLLNNRLSIRASRPDVHYEGTQLSTRGQSVLDRNPIQVNVDRSTYNDNLTMVSLRKVSYENLLDVLY